MLSDVHKEFEKKYKENKSAKGFGSKSASVRDVEIKAARYASIGIPLFVLICWFMFYIGTHPALRWWVGCIGATGFICGIIFLFIWGWTTKTSEEKAEQAKKESEKANGRNSPEQRKDSNASGPHYSES